MARGDQDANVRVRAVTTLAEQFRAGGWATAAIVSSFVLDPRFGWSRGFERYDASFPTAGATLSKRHASSRMPKP